MKAYVILERSLEYNDEIYRATDGGVATEVYLRKQDAERICLDKNTMDLISSNIPLMERGYDFDEILDWSFELHELFKKYGIDLEEKKPLWEMEDEIQKAILCFNKDELNLFAGCVVNPMYYVEEVEFHGPTTLS